MFQTEVFGDPLVNIVFGAYSTGGGGAEVIGDRIYQSRGNLTMVRGKHSLKFGGQYHYRKFYTNTGNPMDGGATFDGGITGFPMADALLGYPSEIRRGQGNTLTDGIGQFLLGYVSDDWRVSKNLTVNVGLMYQLATRPYDSTDRLGNLWVRQDASGKVVGDLMWATTNPEPDPITGRRNEPARTFGFGRSLIQNDYNDIAPRIGFAYKLGSKTVIRSGFGMFYNSTFVQELQDLRKFWPFTIQQVFSPNRGTLDLSITDAGPSFSNTAAIGGWPQNPENRSPYAMQWNLFVQRELMNDLSLEIGYVGSGSRKQIGYSPFNNAITPGPGAINPRRLLPAYGDLDGGSNQYNGSYNSLQVSLLKRYSNGLLLNMNYTWQKSLDGQSSLAEVKVQNPFDRRQDYSRSSWDINHVFNFSYVYELPFGRGRRFGGDWGTVGNILLGGWTLQGITRLESGPPINITTGQDIANTGRSSQRPNLVGDPNAGPKTPDEWFNTKAFARPAQFTFGTAGAFITNADGIVAIDVALGKEFQIRENHALEFKTEFFNIPNTVNFGDPTGAMNNANFGKITTQRTSPRQIQFTLRYRLPDSPTSLTARRVARDQPWFEKNGFRLGRGLGLQEAQSEHGGPLAHRFAALIDCRERHAQTIGILDIATADDRDIIRNFQPGIEDSFHRSESCWVVMTEHGIRKLLEAQELVHCVVSGFVTRIVTVRPIDHIFRRDHDAVVVECPAVPFQTPQGRADVRCSDVGNPPTTNLDQVLRRQIADVLVVHSNKICRQSRNLSVHQDIGRLLLLDQTKAVYNTLGRGDKQAIGAMRQQLVNFLLLEFSILLRG
jgi:hypothetical protein